MPAAPATMTAFEQLSYGQDVHSTIRLNTAAPVPTPKPGQVVVAVKRAAMNPGDYHLSNGTIDMMMKVPFPFTVGRDWAGVVHDVPAGVVTDLKAGDRVFGSFDPEVDKQVGGFAEYAVTDAATIGRIPANVSFDDACAAVCGATTSYNVLALDANLKMQCGAAVLILGGSSACGMAAIQIAKIHGCARIVTTSSAAELCTRLGATEVIDRSRHAWHEVLAGQDFDVIYDCIGGIEAWERAPKVLKKKGGRYCTICGDLPGVGHEHPRLGFGFILGVAGAMANRAFWALAGYPKWVMHMPAKIDRKPWIAAHLGNGQLVAVIDSSYEMTMDGLAAMYAKQKSGTCHGKLVLKVSE
jgi:NADPH:quinone reductase-like Zn-dependent oxidoreductase